MEIWLDKKCQQSEREPQNQVWDHSILIMQGGQTIIPEVVQVNFDFYFFIIKLGNHLYQKKLFDKILVNMFIPCEKSSFISSDCHVFTNKAWQIF